MSWWVGLSREEFWRECQVHKFSWHWNAQYTPPELEPRSNHAERELHIRGRMALARYRELGFDIGHLSNMIMFADPRKSTEELEVIPYHERQSALENR